MHQDATEEYQPWGASANVRGLAKDLGPFKTDSIIASNVGMVKTSGTAESNAGLGYTTRPTNTSVLYCIKAVIAGEVYSTEERVVGTWIDGKPIYQKVITGLSLSFTWAGQYCSRCTTTFAYLGLSNVERFVGRCFGLFTKSNGYDAFWYINADKSSDTDVDLATINEMIINTLVVQYAKTTDG